MSQIDIMIDERGNVKVEGKTADLGSDCKVLTKAIEQALGVTTHVETKAEFRRAPLLKRTVKA